MKKKLRRLTVRDHSEACFLSNAVREHGRRKSDEAFQVMLAAFDRGDRKEAERCQAICNATDKAMSHYLERLRRIIDDFEKWMDAEEGPGPDGGSGGVSHAGMLDGN